MNIKEHLNPIDEIEKPRKFSVTDIINSEKLTKTEHEVIYSTSRGLSIDQIANERLISPFTVRAFHRGILKNYGANNISHAVRLGIEMGDIPFELNPDSALDISPYEKKALEFVSLGFIAVEAANCRDISTRTANYYVQAARRTLNANNHPHMVRRGFELGLIEYSSSESGISALGIMAMMSEYDEPS